MESTLIIKILVLNMLLSLAVHAADTVTPPSPPTVSASPPPSIDSPPPPVVPVIALPPPILPELPIPDLPGLDPRNPRHCMHRCATKCGHMRGFRRLICRSQCMIMCRIKPFDHSGYDCTRDCVMNSLHHQPDTHENLEGLVNGCFSRCTQHV